MIGAVEACSMFPGASSSSEAQAFQQARTVSTLWFIPQAWLLVVHVPSPATCVQEYVGVDVAPVAEVFSVKCRHAPTARDFERYCCVRRRPKDYETQQFIKVSTVS